MGGLRLRTKFLLSMVAVSAALTFTTLYVVRQHGPAAGAAGNPARSPEFSFRLSQFSETT